MEKNRIPTKAVRTQVLPVYRRALCDLLLVEAATAESMTLELAHVFCELSLML